MKLYNIYTHKHNKNKTMNINEVRSIIRQVIAEAMEDKKNGLPKSGGKLVHLKKELQSLKGMREALGQYQIAEGGEGNQLTRREEIGVFGHSISRSRHILRVRG